MDTYNFINGLKLPIIVLGYEPRKLFSVADPTGKEVVPVFSNAEYARAYQKFFQEHRDQDIQTFMLADYDKAINLFEVISMVNPTLIFVAVDPMPPTINNRDEKVLAFDMNEYVQKLRNCKKMSKKRRGRNN